MKHEGKMLHRLSSNPLEQVYHDAWLMENNAEMGCHLLEWLLGENNRRGAVSERDALVAATIIQWLGTPVGQHFIERQQEKFDGPF